MPSRFNHMGLTVTNLEKSVAFYRDVVGMTAATYYEIKTPAFDKLIGIPGLDIKYWMMQLDGLTLQLIEYMTGTGDKLPLRHNKIGSPHLCVDVEDVHAKYAELRKRDDVNVISEIVTQGAGDRYAQSFYATDPDDLPVEFVQIFTKS